MKDNDIIKHCKKGDSKAFEILVYRYSSILMGICYRYLNDEEAAKDALQECFITVFKSIQKFEIGGSFEGWLKRVAVTTSLKAIRSKKNTQYPFAVIIDDNDEYYAEEAVVLQDLEKEEVLKKINQLPDEYRLPFNMFIIEGFSYSEISELLDINENTCRMRVSRARKKLHSILLKDKEYYGFERSRKVD